MTTDQHAAWRESDARLLLIGAAMSDKLRLFSAMCEDDAMRNRKPNNLAKFKYDLGLEPQDEFPAARTGMELKGGSE